MAPAQKVSTKVPFRYSLFSFENENKGSRNGTFVFTPGPEVTLVNTAQRTV